MTPRHEYDLIKTVLAASPSEPAAFSFLDILVIKDFSYPAEDYPAQSDKDGDYRIIR